MTEAPPPLSDPAPPLQPAQVQQQLAAAQLASKKIRRAAAIATTDAWTIAVFAALSFVCGFSGDVLSLLMGAAMGAIAYLEFNGAGRLRRLDPDAPRRLGYNQLAFAGVLIVYALWNLHLVSNGEGLLAQARQYEADFPDVYRIIRLGLDALYFSLIAVAIFAQGGTALYYFTREKHLQRYMRETEPWIVQMQRTGGRL